MDNGTDGECPGTGRSECSWSPFNTLGLCVSTENISDQIVENGGLVSLPALQDFLKQGEYIPTFQSGTYVYRVDGQSASTSMPATSTSDGTTLPSLAEIYQLYYDVCVDRGSGFNQSNPKHWKAIKGQIQFCVQKLESNTYKDGVTSTKVLERKTNLDWYKTTKQNQSTFCTKVESEETDFCVSEMVMQSISHQLTPIFNATAYFSHENRTDIMYSSEWARGLTRSVFGGSIDTVPWCPRSKISQLPNSGGQTPDKLVVNAVDGLYKRLNDIAQSLSHA